MVDIAWPERVSGFLLALELVFILLIGLTAPHALSPAWFAAAVGMLRVPAFTILPLWLLLRAFDAMIGGPARRSRITVVLPMR